MNKVDYFSSPYQTLLWGCPQLCKLGSANHHPQKRHLPRQAGQAQAVVLRCIQTNIWRCSAEMIALLQLLVFVKCQVPRDGVGG